MPHNLYLHSAVVQTRCFEDSTTAGKRQAIVFATINSIVALMLALLVNAAILIVAASVFQDVRTEVAEIQEAYVLLAPLLGAPLASTLFAVALLASGQNSTVTTTLAGQVVMEGFLRLRLPGWLRRGVTRLLAIVPTVVVAAWYGESGTAELLSFSAKSFSVCSCRSPWSRWFGSLPTKGKWESSPFPPGSKASHRVVAALIIGLNIKLLYDFGWI